jgi:hypothetical protein
MPQVFPVSKPQLGTALGSFFPTAPLLIDLEWLHLGDSEWWLTNLADVTGTSPQQFWERLHWILDRIFLNAEDDEETLQETIPDLASFLTAIESAAAQNSAWSGWDVWSAEAQGEGG